MLSQVDLLPQCLGRIHKPKKETKNPLWDFSNYFWRLGTQVAYGINVNRVSKSLEILVSDV